MNRERRDERDGVARQLLYSGEAEDWLSAKALADQRLLCGAKTRSGAACKARKLPGRKRCKMHGGRCNGPNSAEARERLRQRMIEMNRTDEARDRARRLMHALLAKRWGWIPPADASPDSSPA